MPCSYSPGVLGHCSCNGLWYFPDTVEALVGALVDPDGPTSTLEDMWYSRQVTDIYASAS